MMPARLMSMIRALPAILVVVWFALLPLPWRHIVSGSGVRIERGTDVAFESADPWTVRGLMFVAVALALAGGALERGGRTLASVVARLVASGAAAINALTLGFELTFSLFVPTVVQPAGWAALGVALALAVVPSVELVFQLARKRGAR